MPLLTTQEALHVSDSFLFTLYGSETFERWSQLKVEMKFVTEKEYVDWLIDVAYHYKNDEGAASGVTEQLSQNASSMNVLKAEVNTWPEDKESYSDNNAQQSTHSYVDSRVSTPAQKRKRQKTDDEYSEDIKPEFQYALSGGSYPESEAGTSYAQEYNAVPFDSNTNTDDQSMLAADHEAGEIVLSSDDDEANDASTYDEGTGAGLPQMDDDGEVGGVVSPAVTCGPRPPPRLYQCHSCPYTSKYPANVRKHVTGVHEKRKPFACPHCDYCGSQKVSLQQHLIVKHGMAGRYPCAGCDKGFLTPSALRKHAAASGHAAAGPVQS